MVRDGDGRTDLEPDTSRKVVPIGAPGDPPATQLVPMQPESWLLSTEVVVTVVAIVLIVVAYGVARLLGFWGLSSPW